MRVPASLKAFGSLVPALRPEWPGMVRSYVIGTISAMSLVALTVLSAWAVGHAVVDRVLPGPVLWLGLGGLVLARTVLTWREMDVSHALAYRVLARLRMALFDAYARSVPGKKREHSGRVASVAMDDIEKLEFFYAHTIAQVATSITVFLASAITALAILPPAGGVVVLGGAVIATSAFYWAHTARRLGAAEQHERTEMSAGIVDALGALREVLAYNLTSRVVHDTREATARATTIARRREMLAQLVTSVRELTVTAVVIGVIATSAISAGVLDGSGGEAMSAAVLPALIALSIAGVSAVTDATTTVTQLHPLTASAERVSAGIHRAPVVRTPETKRALPDGSLGLRFDHVSFSYEDRKPTLRSFTAEIEPGEHVGLSGASGAGKSTIIALASGSGTPTAERSSSEPRTGPPCPRPRSTTTTSGRRSPSSTKRRRSSMAVSATTSSKVHGRGPTTNWRTCWPRSERPSGSAWTISWDRAVSACPEGSRRACAWPGHWPAAHGSSWSTRSRPASIRRQSTTSPRSSPTSPGPYCSPRTDMNRWLARRGSTGLRAPRRATGGITTLALGRYPILVRASLPRGRTRTTIDFSAAYVDLNVTVAP